MKFINDVCLEYIILYYLDVQKDVLSGKITEKVFIDGMHKFCCKYNFNYEHAKLKRYFHYLQNTFTELKMKNADLNWEYYEVIDGCSLHSAFAMVHNNYILTEEAILFVVDCIKYRLNQLNEHLLIPSVILNVVNDMHDFGIPLKFMHIEEIWEKYKHLGQGKRSQFFYKYLLMVYRNDVGDLAGDNGVLEFMIFYNLTWDELLFEWGKLNCVYKFIRSKRYNSNWMFYDDLLKFHNDTRDVSMQLLYIPLERIIFSNVTKKRLKNNTKNYEVKLNRSKKMLKIAQSKKSNSETLNLRSKVISKSGEKKKFKETRKNLKSVRKKLFQSNSDSSTKESIADNMETIHKQPKRKCNETKNINFLCVSDVITISDCECNSNKKDCNESKKNDSSDESEIIKQNGAITKIIETLERGKQKEMLEELIENITNKNNTSKNKEKGKEIVKPNTGEAPGNASTSRAKTVKEAMKEPIRILSNILLVPAFTKPPTKEIETDYAKMIENFEELRSLSRRRKSPRVRKQIYNSLSDTLRCEKKRLKKMVEVKEDYKQRNEFLTLFKERVNTTVC
ncbi:unnamed protein product [Brassicogethes aeneus]|uniref:Uncharacterized protein n=1 Tax=Brassicogethes aeneus TaxID=1431903 RepID=A0A9P0BK88_BRAAE|nr:unnamed protein product [Brassicogethes aeneus]